MSLIEAMKSTGSERLATSVIVHGEVMTGFVMDTKRAKSAKAVWQQFLAGVEVLEVTREVAEIWGELRGFLRRVGLTTGDNDLLIAATALSHDMTVVTRNVKDYGRVPGLTLLTPVY